MHDPQTPIPDRLARDLRTLEPQASWPGDDPVIAAAWAQLRGRPSRRPLRIGAWSAGLAAAAGLAISAMVWLNQPVRHGPAGGLASGGDTPAAAGPASPVTMLDAYRLALMLERREAVTATSWDANADGAIDGRDVEALAARAVSLKETTS